MGRALIPPLTIALALIMAGTLLVTAAAIVPPPIPCGSASAPSPATVSDAHLAQTTLVHAPFVRLPPGSIVVGLARLTYAPGAISPRHALPGPLLLVVEAGTLTAHLDSPGQLLRPDSPRRVLGEVVLHQGDSLLLPAATAVVFHNEGVLPSLVLAVGVFPTTILPREPLPIGLSQGQSVRWRDEWSPGARVHALAGGWLVAPPSAATIALQRLSLPSGGGLTLPAPGAAVLAVEAGALKVVAGGRGWLQHPDGPDDGMRPGADVTLLPGDDAVLRDRASLTLRNDGESPLLALQVVVVPAPAS